MNADWMPGGAKSEMGTDWVLGGRYRLISRVGSGGMAVVWQAYDEVLARTVAVKILAAHYADDALSRGLIRREAQAAAGLSHPNIAQVYDYGEADVNGEVVPYVVMELIRGGTLQQRITDGPVLPRYAMRICAEIAAALAAAHAEGLAHRDIKPANVMLAPTGAKVVDFGIAAAIRPSGSGTDDFEVLGTPAYLAPERLLHDAVEPASDVYALGMLLYRLLAGHSPWTSETTTQMLTAHIYLEPAPLMPMFQVPDYVTALCNRCLAKDPTQRPSAREAAALLAHGSGLPIIVDEPLPVAHEAPIDPHPSVLIRPPTSGEVTADRSPPPPPGALPPPSPDDDAPGDGQAETGARNSVREEAEPAAVPSHPVPDPAQPATAKPRRTRYVLAAAALLLAVAATLLLLRYIPQQAVLSAPAPATSGVQSAPGPTASGAARKGLPGASAAQPVPAPSRPGPVLTTGTRRNGAGPAAGQTVPATSTAGPAVTGPGAAKPPTGAPKPTATTKAPPAEPEQRTLSSSAGSVQATCPAAGTAQILSWAATRPYKVTQGDKTAGPAPAVSFKHGNTRVTMTVTCDGGVPSAAVT